MLVLPMLQPETIGFRDSTQAPNRSYRQGYGTLGMLLFSFKSFQKNAAFACTLVIAYEDGELNSEPYLLIKRSVIVDRKNNSWTWKTPTHQMRKFQPKPGTQSPRIWYSKYKPWIIFFCCLVELLVDLLLHKDMAKRWLKVEVPNCDMRLNATSQSLVRKDFKKLHQLNIRTCVCIRPSTKKTLNT